MGQASSAESQRLSKISKVKGSKGRVNMLNLSRSIPEECDEKLLSQPSNNKARGDEALTELLKSMQKQLNSLEGQIKVMKLDIRQVDRAFQMMVEDTGQISVRTVSLTVACAHCFICGGEGDIARRCPQKGNGQGLRN